MNVKERFLSFIFLNEEYFPHSLVPPDSPSRGGDVTVYVKDINQPSLPTHFTLSLCLFLSLRPFKLYFIP